MATIVPIIPSDATARMMRTIVNGVIGTSSEMYAMLQIIAQAIADGKMNRGASAFPVVCCGELQSLSVESFLTVS